MSRSSPVAMASALPSSRRRSSKPTTPLVRRKRYSGIRPSDSMPGVALNNRSCCSRPARCATQAAMCLALS